MGLVEMNTHPLISGRVLDCGLLEVEEMEKLLNVNKIKKK